MIYDCFPFLNELDLLDIRLHELNEIVDKFILVESTITHRGKPKSLYYQKNKDKFKEFNDKIVHIVVDTYPDDSPWERERYQPSQACQALEKCTEKDIVMISDVDEIPRASIVKNLTPDKFYKLEMREFHYWLNCITGLSYGTTSTCNYQSGITTFDNLAGVRHFASGELIKNAGWHFSYMAPAENIKYKLESFMPGDYLGWSIEQTKEWIERNPPEDFQKGAYGRKMQLVNFDETFPKYLLDNLNKFRHMIHPSMVIK